jgi:basic membrane lipoprotein Med (substrate-binding protein (PBP1-ABC) superfamily)
LSIDKRPLSPSVVSEKAEESSMKKTNLIIFSLVFFILLSINPATAGNPPKLVGLAIPEAGTDKGWNEQGKTGLEIVAEKYGFKIESFISF